MKKDIEKIAEHFGLKAQQVKTIEELEELIQAIQNIRKKFTVDNYENLSEEIADVEIMLFQMKHLHEIQEDDLNFIKKEKIERTIRRYEIDG